MQNANSVKLQDIQKLESLEQFQLLYLLHFTRDLNLLLVEFQCADEFNLILMNWLMNCQKEQMEVFHEIRDNEATFASDINIAAWDFQTVSRLN